MILAASGVLDDTAATTKRAVVPPEISPLERMRDMYPRIDVREAPIVDAGAIVTGGGVSLCIDTTLHILGKCSAKKLRTKLHAFWNISGPESQPEHEASSPNRLH